VTLLASVSDHLQQRTVAHALIGAAALALHGVSRSTFDQDILVTDTRVLDDAFWQQMTPPAHADVRRGDGDDPLAGVVRMRAESERDVDIVVGRYTWQADMLARSEPIPHSGGLRVVRAADLVLLKLFAGGSQDRWDIEQLLALDESGALIQEVESRLSALPQRCAAAWASLRRQG
jgi:hypothetical protein